MKVLLRWVLKAARRLEGVRKRTFIYMYFVFAHDHKRRIFRFLEITPFAVHLCKIYNHLRQQLKL